jgi:subtilisin
MKGIFAYVSDEAAVVIGRQLHARDGRIIGSLERLVDEPRNALIARPGSLVRVEDGAQTELKRFGCLTDDDIAGTLSHHFSQGFDFSCCNNIEDMLIFLYRLTKSKSYGFCDGNNIRILQSPHEDRTLAELHGLLDKNLELVDKLCQVETQVKYSGGLLKRFSASMELREGRKRTKDLIECVLDYRKGPIRKIFLMPYLAGARNGIESQSAQLPKRDWTVQERLEQEFLPRKEKSAILTLGNYVHAQSAYGLEKETGLKVRAFRTLPLLSVKGDRKDVQRFYELVSSRSFGKFGSGIIKACTGIAYSHGVFIPELAETISPRHRRKNDTLWNLVNIGADKAQDYSDGKGSTVAVVDTGIDYRHKELESRFGKCKGINIVGRSDDPMDDNRHGTHVAGTVAGKTTGVSPGCSLYAVKVLNSDGAGFMDEILLGIDWCITNKVDVINLSLGCSFPSQVEEKMYAAAAQKGIICVAAAGNEGYGPSYPAAYDSVIAVAAVDKANEHAKYSNIYYTNSISAPGTDIHSALPGGGYGLLTGTSMASPHIAGVASLVRSKGTLDKRGFDRLIGETALPLGDCSDSDNKAVYGAGLVQADKAVRR